MLKITISQYSKLDDFMQKSKKLHVHDLCVRRDHDLCWDVKIIQNILKENVSVYLWEKLTHICESQNGQILNILKFTSNYGGNSTIIYGELLSLEFCYNFTKDDLVIYHR